MEITQLAEALRRRWLTFLFTVALVTGAVIGYTLLQEARYEATTRVVATPITTTEGQSPREAIAFAQTQARSFPGVATSNDVLMPAIRELDLAIRPDSLARRIDATVPTEALWMDIAVEDASAEMAAAISRSIATHFIARINRLNGSAATPQNVRVVVISRAEAPTSASSPQWPVTLAATALLSVLAGLIAVAGREVLDGRIRGAAEVQRILERPTFMQELSNEPLSAHLLDSTAVAGLLRATMPVGGSVAVIPLAPVHPERFVRALGQALTRLAERGLAPESVRGTAADSAVTASRDDRHRRIDLIATGPFGEAADAFEAASWADHAVLLLTCQTNRAKVRETQDLLDRYGCPIVAAVVCRRTALKQGRSKA